MSERKVVSSSIAIGLAVLVVVMTVAFLGTLIYSINTPNSSADESAATIATLQAPNVINVGLGARDDGAQPPYEPNLHISGYVVNTGPNTAYNVKLHVVAYYFSGAKAIDTEVTVGNGMIRGLDSVQINMIVPYDINALGQLSAQSATMSPEWTANP